MTDERTTPDRKPAEEMPAGEHVIQISDWLQGKREVWIEHDGVRYRLRVTRRNRLILQK